MRKTVHSGGQWWRWLDPKQDHTHRAAFYLTVLGLFNLIGLNLVGLLWLFAAGGIRRHSRRWRQVIILLCVAWLLGVLAGMVWVVVAGVQGTHLNTPVSRHPDPPGWLILGLMAISIMVHVPPLWWLTRSGTEAAWTYHGDNGQHLCSRCLYDLRGNVTGRCPECGEVIESRHS